MRLPAEIRPDQVTSVIDASSTRSLVVEACWSTIESGQYRSKITPAAAMGSLLGWIAAGLPIIMARDRENAAKIVSKLLFIAARRRWREARTLASGIASGGPADG